jgi:LysR family cys regulon transcriptional activator
MAAMAFDAKRDRPLQSRDASHLFPSSTTRLGIKRGAWLRRFTYDFIELLAPQLSRELVASTVAGKTGSRYEL